MKIVFIAPFGLRPKATVGDRALRLAKALAARGHQVTVLIPPWDDPARSGQSWLDEGVEVVNVPLPVGLPLLFHLWLTARLVRQALARQPEVIHFFKPKAYAGLAHLALWGWRRVTGARWRLVLDSDDWEQAWNEISGYSPAQKLVFSWQERWGLAHAEALTVASREIERLAGPYAGLAPLIYLPNGQRPETDFSQVEPVDEATVRQKWQLGDGPVILLYSRFLEFRLARIVTLVEQVAAELPAARWLMVGQGLRGEEIELQTLLQQAGLERYTRFTGWLPLADLPGCFQVADVAIYPYDDTLINRTKCSVKLIDLLAAGLPVVADAVGQNCDYIEADVSGRLVPAEDDVAFSRAIVALLRQPAQAQALGQAAARRIRQRYTWPQLALPVEAAYLDLTGRR